MNENKLFDNIESKTCINCIWHEPEFNYCILLQQDDMKYCNKFEEDEFTLFGEDNNET